MNIASLVAVVVPIRPLQVVTKFFVGVALKVALRRIASVACSLSKRLAGLRVLRGH